MKVFNRSSQGRSRKTRVPPLGPGRAGPKRRKRGLAGQGRL